MKCIRAGITVITAEKQYDALPEAARNYVSYLEQQLDVPVSIISVGPGREQLILRDLVDVAG